ncbi:MAG TPA: 8-amino-7-oxononanoate synthase, partial [Thermodesulfovibrionia bacterium]|nr:8-amino-7-oxononanoate synthase [Thermodesulfovibrionia bacterium]
MFGDRLKALEEQGLLRSIRWIESAANEGGRIRTGGREVLNFASNDYLGLSCRREIIEAAAEALSKYGMSMASSRLLSGSHELHQRLEERIAVFKEAEAALVFTSGYAANVGIIPALVKRGDGVFSDKLNHASIIDGLRLSGASLFFYRHKDMEHLEKLLKNDVRGNKLIVTDTVFSMDGDIAPLSAICGLADRYGAMVLVDDAHGTGVLGNNGRGALEYLGLEQRKDILVMGTMSKALGCIGGFIAGSQELILYMVNKARSFIYTTAMPPFVAAACIKAVDIVETEPDLRHKLTACSTALRDGLKKRGFNTLDSETPIIPLVTGKIDKALELSVWF